jgi:hypothetical protein
MQNYSASSSIASLLQSSNSVAVAVVFAISTADAIHHLLAAGIGNLAPVAHLFAGNIL